VDCRAALGGVVELVLIDVVILFAGQKPNDLGNAVAPDAVNLV